MSDPQMRRIRFLAEIAKKKQGRQGRLGKTAMQKYAYMLQTLYGVKLGYRFSLYNYGPYSKSLMGDLDIGDFLSLIDVEFEEDAGYRIVSSGDADFGDPDLEKEVLASLSELDSMFDVFGDMNAKQLELRSTITFVAEDNPKITRQELTERTSSIKPQFDEDEVEQAIADVERTGKTGPFT